MSDVANIAYRMRLSKSLCRIVGEVLSTTGSHATLEALFENAGAPGDPPGLSHASKWKEWLFRAGVDPDTNSLAVLGNVLEEFMDVAPDSATPEFAEWKRKRGRIEQALEENGLRYFRFGRVLPQGQTSESAEPQFAQKRSSGPTRPNTVEELLLILLPGIVSVKFCKNGSAQEVASR